MALTTTGRNVMLNGLTAVASHVSLHTADPSMKLPARRTHANLLTGLPLVAAPLSMTAPLSLMSQVPRPLPSLVIGRQEPLARSTVHAHWTPVRLLQPLAPTQSPPATCLNLWRSPWLGCSLLTAQALVNLTPMYSVDKAPALLLGRVRAPAKLLAFKVSQVRQQGQAQQLAAPLV
jgi:hypothetical protein